MSKLSRNSSVIVSALSHISFISSLFILVVHFCFYDKLNPQCSSPKIPLPQNAYLATS